MTAPFFSPANTLTTYSLNMIFMSLFGGAHTCSSDMCYIYRSGLLGNDSYHKTAFLGTKVSKVGSNIWKKRILAYCTRLGHNTLKKRIM